MNIPNVSDIVRSWAVPMEAILITKHMENRQLVETQKRINFHGVPLQPRTQNLQLKPEGERDWRYFTLYCTHVFNLDDIVVLNGVNYRINQKIDWNASGCYGFREYELVEDYHG
ncbi:hypothetical protein FACS1894152_1680 [Bacilli bacterium]|nr:hypothetical protein FACS1894152_1680 [Bacilli bacterium]